MSGKMGAAAAAIGMVLLILDPVTAMEGARQGIGTCLQTLIPSLFPMMVLGIYLTGALDGSLILAGWLGGYPVGAKVVDQAYRSGRLSKGQAQRMLVACNQCGPAFLFGVGHQILGRGWACWLLWAILLLSAGIAGALLTKRSGLIPGGRTQPISFPQALENGVKVMGTVCGWVVLFRVALGFLERWGLDAACQQTVVARLEKEKFIDETRYARCFVRDKFRYNGWGRVKMAQALRLKGISPSCIEKAMDEIEEEEYSRTLQKLLQSKARSLKGGTDYERNGKLVRFGLSRGFEMPLIMRVLHVEEDFA